MSKKTGYLLGILLTIIIGMLLMWFFCCGSGAASGITNESDQNNQVVAPEKPAPTQMGFSIKDPDGNFSFSNKANLDFNASGFSILQPVAGAVDEGIGKLQAYFNKDGNAGKFVDITGYYDTDEDNNSAFPNLGLARANAVKNYFVSKGISSSRINTYGELRDALVPDGTIYRGPVSFKVGTYDNENGDAEEMAALKARINANPLVLNFNTAQASISLTPEQRQKVADISRYLDHVSGSSASIVGHTDNTGNPASHVSLGLKRAEFAKGYFKRNGIAEAQLKTSSKGDKDPAADNATEEGRAINRRSVVTLN